MILVWLKSGERAAPRCRSVQQYLSENVKLTCPKTDQNREYHSIQGKRIQKWAAAKSGGAQHKGGLRLKTRRWSTITRDITHWNWDHDKMSNRTLENISLIVKWGKKQWRSRLFSLKLAVIWLKLFYPHSSHHTVVPVKWFTARCKEHRWSHLNI